MIVNKGKKLFHSSIRIAGEKTVYIDPWQIEDAAHDADLVLVTHDHHDHFSPEDIAKVSNGSTILAVPKSMADQAPDGAETVEPGMQYLFADIPVETVAAYNLGRPFHGQERGYVGYIVTVDGVRYFVAGDTDLNP